jgi:myo-inositol-1(or 4)-monophosphatase
MNDFSQLASPLEQVVKQAGSFIARERIGFQAAEVSSKSFNQLVSYVDCEAENMLVKGLQKILPEAGFLTEEQTTVQQTEGLHWIIDPLDGTTNFIHQVPVYSVSVALALGSTLLLGAVYEINRNEYFAAAKGKGATLNGQPLQVSTHAQLGDTLMATGFPYYDFDGLDRYISVLKELMRTTRGLRRLGSAAVDLAYVACGRFDGFFELSLRPWDVAAGCLLVQEAGGVVTDFSGGDNYLHGRSIVAASAAIHPQMQQLITRDFFHR